MTDVLNADGIVSGTELENRLQRPADNELGLGVEQALSRDLLTARLKGGVMVVDENFKIVMIDRRAAKFFGVSSGQSQGKGFYSLFPGLNGSLFASELHEVIIAIGEKRCARPSHNRLLDQFVNAFGAGPESREPILAISMRAYRDGSNIYGLIRIHFNAQTDSSAPSPATPGHQGQAADSECSQAVAINRNIRFDPDSVLLVVDCHGYILAATSEGDSRRLDIQIFSCADPSEELILLCRDRTHSSLVAEELANRGRLFDCAAKSVADAVLVVDAEGFVTEMNPMAEQLLGFELDTSKTMQIEAVMPLANEETGVRVTPVHDALTQATNIQETESLLLKIRGAEPMPVAVSAFPMRDAMNRMQKCLVILRPLSEARRVSSRLRWQSMHDTLTGLPNRKSLAERLQRSIESAKLEGSIHALLYIDLYNFSVINDTSGHMAGDELLVQFARLLMEITGPSDIAARIGNDEFALLLHCINYDKAMAMAEQVLEVIKDFSIPWEGETLRVGASIGGIMIDSEALSDIDLMISAGSSCAAARDKGRNKIHFQSFNEEVTKRRRLATSMPKIVSALDENRFTLFAQPIVSLNPNVALPKYYEILVRMRDSDGTIVPPSEFIPVAEHFSLIDDLDKWVFTNALKFLQKRQKRGELLPTLAVNLSGTTVGDENAIDYILAGFSDSGIPPKHIQFEITETAAVKHLPEAKRLIATLRSVGVSFALDDFGSGLSSFAYLKELPIDCLKIDASFIKTMDNSDVDYSVVSTINHLGHIMGVSTVAEGVESKSQHQLLKKIGVDYIQGFLVKHPQLLDKIIDPI